MHKHKYLQAPLFLFLLSVPFGCTAPERIPIGFVVKQPAQSILTAFRYAISQHNSNQNPMGFKLDPRIDILDTDDVLSVGRVVCQQMKKGIFAMMGLTQTTLYSTLNSYSQSFHMPYINLNFMPNQTSLMKAASIAPSNSNFHLNLRPFHAAALVDLIRHYDWKDLIYLYDEDEGSYLMQSVIHTFTQSKIDVRVQRIASAEEGHFYLKSVDFLVHTMKKHVILDMSVSKAQALITLNLEDKAMMRKQYHYVMAQLGVEEYNFEHLKFTGVNLTAFTLMDLENDKYKQIALEWAQLDPDAGWLGAGGPLTTDAALQLDAMALWVTMLNRLFREKPNIFQNNFRRGELFNNGSRGLDCTKYPSEHWEHGRLLMQTLKSTKYRGLTGDLIFDASGDRRNYTLNLVEMTFNRKVLIGTWSEQEGLLVTRRFQTVDVILPPKGDVLLTVTSIIEEPYLMWKKPKDGEELKGNARFEGFCVDLLEKIARLANFTYEIKLVNDSLYGRIDSQGNWNGMIGELIRKEADLVVAPLTITSQREKYVDFTKPFMTVGIGIMIKKPLKTKPGVFSFMEPLSYDIWICVIFAYIGVSVVLFLVSRFSPYEWHIEETFNGPVVVNEFSMYNTLWFSLGAFMQQGGHIYPRSISGRLAGSVWWFFTLIIISSYTANLAAFLTVERLSTPIKSADDLSKQQQIEYGMYKGGSTYSFFNQSQVEIYKKMWDFMSKREHVFMPSNQEGFIRVRRMKGKYAFLAETPVIEYENNRKPCDTMKVGEDLDSKGYGIATPTGSLLTERLSQAILYLKEDGTLANMQKEWWELKRDRCQAEAESQDTNELQLNNVAGCFYILIIGLILSMISAVLEFLYKAQKDARKHAVPIKRAVKAKAKFSVQGGTFKDPKQLCLGPCDPHMVSDGLKEAIFRKSHTQV
ncbi:glutamate receptor-like isoform X2 [Paramacrobiotus metropolitanus]|uniref:glutamate receptor-like isoform X2 n=1 Tax=Paramacrobiotus metropolitanus TaxID=2943436 RepID=UPI0024456A62|nr:glutamate receptor-like isoform X2 [Paramacrobiotus metropolitanus]